MPKDRIQSERAEERRIRHYGKSTSDTLRSSGLVGPDRQPYQQPQPRVHYPKNNAVKSRYGMKPVTGDVAAPYNFADKPAIHKVKSFSKGPTLPVSQRNTAIEHDELESKRITKIPMGVGFDEPLADGERNFKLLKGFKQAKQMTVEMTGFKNNPVRQDMDEAYGRFEGQEQG